jgi:hypothetical protein
MAYLIAGVAFVVGLSALYLASEAIKKIDRELETFITTHLNMISERLRDNEADIRAIKAEVALQKRETDRVRNSLEVMELGLRMMNDEINRIRVDLQVLQRKNDPDPRRRINIAS